MIEIIRILIFIIASMVGIFLSHLFLPRKVIYQINYRRIKKTKKGEFILYNFPDGVSKELLDKFEEQLTKVMLRSQEMNCALLTSGCIEIHYLKGSLFRKGGIK